MKLDGNYQALMTGIFDKYPIKSNVNK